LGIIGLDIVGENTLALSQGSSRMDNCIGSQERKGTVELEEEEEKKNKKKKKKKKKN
jgi:hypothetical protein